MSLTSITQSPTFAKIYESLKKRPRLSSPVSSWIMQDYVSCATGNLSTELKRSLGGKLNEDERSITFESITKAGKLANSSSPGMNFVRTKQSYDDSVNSCKTNDDTYRQLFSAPKSYRVSEKDSILEQSLHQNEKEFLNISEMLSQGSKLNQIKAFHQNEKNHLHTVKAPRKWIRWTPEEDKILKIAVQTEGECWRKISEKYFERTRNQVQCKNRWRKTLQPGLCKNKWTADEDQIILRCVRKGMTKWSEIASHIPGRLGEQIKERWINTVNPDCKRGAWTEDEIKILEIAQKRFGNKWSQIAKLLPGRSENSVKNRWYNSRTSALRANKRHPSSLIEKSKI